MEDGPADDAPRDSALFANNSTDASDKRRNLRLLMLGTPSAFEYIECAVSMTGVAWEVELVRDISTVDVANVGALLVPCDSVDDPEVVRLGDLTDSPVILYTATSSAFSLATGRPVEAPSVISFSALPPQELVSTIRSAIERWGHARAIQAKQGGLDDARETRTEFLAAVNHEVRTPLNAILGMAEMLLETNLDGEQNRFARVIQSSGGDLLRVLNQLVDLTRLRAGNVRVAKTEFDLANLVQAAAESESVEIGKRKLGISVCIDPHLPRTVNGPAESLSEVLRTLIACSVRQTASGEIRVGAAVDPKWRDGSIVHFFIQHTGDSVDSERLAQTFAVFATGDPPISRDHGGVGIGLALAAGLVRNMGGEIWSEEDARRLCFAIPLQPMCIRSDEMTPTSVLQGVRICVAIAQPGERSFLSQTLEAAGAFVRALGSAQEVREVLIDGLRTDLPVDIVVLDEEDCVPHFLAFIAGSRSTRVPVVAMGFPEEGRSPRPVPDGVALRIAKPGRADEIIAEIDALARGVQPKHESASPPSALKLLVADDSLDNRALIEIFLAKSPYEIRFAEDGSKAVEAFLAEDFDIVLMDIQMPVLNGYEATQQIRQYEASRGLKPTPIVALTAFAFDEDVELSLASGCDLHLSKPISKKTLLELLSKWANDCWEPEP